MDGSAPEEIIQYTDQQTADFHKNVAKPAEQLTGQPIQPQSLNPDDQSSLERIRQTVDTKTKDPVRIIKGIVEEYVSGESSATHVGTTGGKEPILMWLRRKLLKRAA